MSINWLGAQQVDHKSWVCGYCEEQVASIIGYNSNTSHQGICIRICPVCDCPTYFGRYGNTPQNAPGNRVNGVPPELHRLYDEARKSSAAGAYTGAVMICRKILMILAVDKGAQHKATFQQYVDYLDQKNFIPPDGNVWVDYIRIKGNEANHEIQLMEAEDAQALITFVEMLFRIIYQFPNMVPQASSV